MEKQALTLFQLDKQAWSNGILESNDSLASKYENSTNKKRNFKDKLGKRPFYKSCLKGRAMQ